MRAVEQPIVKYSDDQLYQLSIINIDISNYSFQIVHIFLFQSGRLVMKDGTVEHPSLNTYIFSILNILSLNSVSPRKLVRKGPLTFH